MGNTMIYFSSIQKALYVISNLEQMKNAGESNLWKGIELTALVTLNTKREEPDFNTS